MVGTGGDETGSFLATLAGSVLGLGPIGATIGFNLTRRYELPPTESDTALINLSDGQVSLAVPRVYFRPDPFGGRGLTQRVALVRVRF